MPHKRKNAKAARSAPEGFSLAFLQQCGMGNKARSEEISFGGRKKILKFLSDLIGATPRNLPHDFPPWKTVYSFFRRANISGLWDEILEFLVEITRQVEGKQPEPAYAIIDSQSVKTVSASEQRGIDGGKKN